MSDPFLTDPPRWSDQATEPGQVTPAERDVGVILARVREATEPNAEALRRVRRRDRAAAPGWNLLGVWRVVIVSVVLMAMASAVGAALVKWRHIDLGGILRPRRDVTLLEARPDRQQRGRRAGADRDGRGLPVAGDPPAAMEAGEPSAPTTAPPAPVVSSESTPTSPAVTARSSSVPVPPVGIRAGDGPTAHRRADVRVAAGDTVPLAADQASGAASGEAGLLGGAFRRLRAGADPAEVLHILDGYDRRFPDGTLRAEARIARAEALVALGRRGDALPLLEGIDESADLLTRDVRIARGELLAEVGRCTRAIGDFDLILAVGSQQDEAAGRALFGRASCRLHAGDVAGARKDLETYLALHADGPSAAAARRALDTMP